MKKDSLTQKTVQLLFELNRHKINTLESLSNSLGLPKPTLHRLLNELINLQLVIKHADTHLYSITSQCQQLSNGVTSELHFIEKASEKARQLTHQYEWPIAIATAETDGLLVRFSSRPDARFSFIKSTVGKRFPMVGSALGEAWLANRPIREQKKLIRSIPDNLIQRRLRQVKTSNITEYLNQVCDQGYALRYGRSGETSHMALPIIHSRRVLGVMGISVFTTAIGEQIVPLYLPALRNASKEIIDSL